MDRKDAFLVGLALMAAAILGSCLLLLDPVIHAGFLSFLGDIVVGLKILFFTGVSLGSAAIGFRIWKGRSALIVRDGKEGQIARAVIYKGTVVQISSAEGLGLTELMQMQSQLVGQQQKTMQVVSSTSTAVQRLLPLLEEYEEDDDVVEDRPRIEAPRDEYLNISKDYQPHADEFLSGRKLIVGVAGSGKSNSTASVCEELGRLNVPMVLADTENEYESLCDRRWLPHAMKVDSRVVTIDSAEQFGRHILEQNIQAVLNLHSYEMPEAAQIMINLIAGMKQWQEERANEVRIPCEFLLEEATTWLPQNVNESQLNGTEVFARLQDAFFNDMVRKGRKRGLGLTVICQKIAEIDKRALQCDVKLLHRQTELNDLKKYVAMGITNDETLSLADGAGYFFSSKVNKMLIQMRRRYSQHGANTPGLSELRQYQQSRQSFPGNLASGNKNWQGNDYGNTAETASVPDLKVIDGVFPSEIDTSVELPSKGVSREKRETIKRLAAIGMAHRDAARIVGLSGRNYHIYQLVCKEEGIVPHEAMEGI